MAEFGDLPTPMMRATACLQSDNAGRLSGKERQHLPASQLLAKHHIPRGIRPMSLENPLGDIQPDCANLFHGRSPFMWFLTITLWHIDAVGGRPPHHIR
jgi:hypothetical protein